MNVRTPWLAIALLPLAAAAAPWVTELSFRPADDTKVVRRHAFVADFELGDVSVTIDGQDLSESIPSDFEASLETSMEIRDHFVRSGQGRALELIRTFESIEGEFSGMGETQPMDGIDKLVGKSVRFVWNEDDGDYDVSFYESEGDPDDLESLSADMDLSILLPERDVSEGDVWDVPSEKLEKMLMLDKLSESAGDDEMGQLMVAEMLPQLRTLLESFKTSCAYKGEREEEGRRVGVIAVDIEGEGVIDLEALILGAIDSQNPGIELDIGIDQAELELSISGKGEVLWDLGSGILAKFDLSADIEIVASLALNADVQGESHDMEGELELLGRGNWQIRTPVE